MKSLREWINLSRTGRFILAWIKCIVVILFILIAVWFWKDDSVSHLYFIERLFPGINSFYMQNLSIEKGTEISGSEELNEKQDMKNARSYSGEMKKGKIFWIKKSEYLDLTDREWKLFRNNLKYIYSKRYSYVSVIFEDGTGIQFKGRMDDRAWLGNMDNMGHIVRDSSKVDARTMQPFIENQ